MILARFIGMVIMFIPAVVIATTCRSAVSGIVTPIADATGLLSDFEVAMMLIIPYMILVYLAIVNPIINFWSSLRSKDIPRRDYE